MLGLVLANLPFHYYGRIDKIIYKVVLGNLTCCRLFFCKIENTNKRSISLAFELTIWKRQGKKVNKPK